MSYTNGLDKPSDYFNTVLWTGNGTSQSITGVNFQPDLVWLKSRSIVESHGLFDVIRGAGERLISNSTDAEATRTSVQSSFDSDGFSVGGSAQSNQSSATYCAWNWLAGGTASSNTDGSITSSVSANTTAGFSIVKWSASTSATIGHGLGQKPAMVITKSRNNATNWATWHQNLTGGSEEDRFLNLNSTGATTTYTDYWGTGGFTSSVFGVLTSGFHNNAGEMIAYCFAEKKGYSKFGSYTGNGSTDGTFVYTGFKPAWVMVKRTDSTGQWGIADNKRGVAPSGEFLFAESSGATNSAPNNFDFLSNGFKSRANYAANNTSSATYIYMAFAESPFVTSSGIPTCAR